MELTSLADIKPHKPEWRIQVKVLHTWKQFTPLSGETLEIILADAHGTKIHASCKKMYFDQLANKVPVGMWRNIDNFSLTSAPTSFRATNHQYKMNFIHSTAITPSSLQNDSMFVDLVDFQTIKTGNLDPNFLIDVIGQVSEIGELETIQCSGKPKKKIEFGLNDLAGNRISCCLWGKFADTFRSKCQGAGETMVICLIRFAKIGTFRNEVQISNSFDVSQILINPAIEEAEPFYQRDLDYKSLTLVETQQHKVEREIRRDKWMQFAQRDIRDLLQSTEIGQCRVIATIYAIDKDWGWYYFGCNDCQKRVYKIAVDVKMVNGNQITTHVWWCEKCKAKVIKVTPKFRFHLMVKDGTSVASLMILDWTANGIMTETAEELLNGSLEELQDIENFPESITSLVGKTFMFGVFIEKDNVTSKGGIYKVGKVWQDLSLLLSGGSIESCSQSDVGNADLSGSQGSIVRLESEGNEDSVVTPTSKRKETSNEVSGDLNSSSKKQCTKVFFKNEKSIKEDSSSKNSG